MSDNLLNALWIIPILAFLIIVHEIGHFVTARMVGVKVEEFGIGIPPRIKGWRRRGVLWSINAIPFGGFVRVLGEDGKSMDPESMNTKTPGQRAFFLSAGSAMNFLTAFVLMFVLVGFYGIASTNVYIGQVRDGSPAAVAGWQTGDRIVEVAGAEVDDAAELTVVVREFSGRPMSVVLERGGELIETTVTPREDPPAGEGPTGVHLQNPQVADIVVRDTEPGSLAAQAGWQGGDSIVSVNGREILDAYALQFEFSHAQGETVPVVVQTNGDQRETQIAIPVTGMELLDIQTDSPAAEAGWQRGDRVVAIDGLPPAAPADVDWRLREAQGTTIPVTLERAGERQETQLAVPEFGSNDNAAAVIGINAEFPSVLSAIGLEATINPHAKSVPVAQVIPTGLSEAWTTSTQMVSAIRELVTSRDQWGQVAGPIGMGQITSEALSESPLPTWVVLVRLSIILSLNLAVLNLLPLPALDGGRLFFVLIEFLRGGRKIAPEKEGIVHFAGLILLLGLMFVIAFFDVDRIREGRSFFE